MSYRCRAARSLHSAPDLYLQQQEQDPTNLYIANLPQHFKESDLDNLLSKYGQVISTRILRDSMGVSKGVGFARMENKEKCDDIIRMFNGNALQGCKEPLLVKFADGGNKKKNMYKNNENAKMWRDGSEAMAVAGYDPNALAQNGVATQHMIPATISNFRGPYGQVSQHLMTRLGLPVIGGLLLILPSSAADNTVLYKYDYYFQYAGYPPGTQWVPQYVMSTAMPPVDDSYNLTGHMPYKNDGQGHRGIPVMLQSPEAAVQYTNMLPQVRQVFLKEIFCCHSY